MSCARAALGCVVTVLAASGCTAVAERGDAAAATAVRLLSAVAERDGAAACGLLAPETAAEVEQSADRPCAEAILNEQLPAAGPVTATHVYGQRAQVRLSADTVFLAVFPGGWRVVAAGCTPEGEKPYDCVIEGG